MKKLVQTVLYYVYCLVSTFLTTVKENDREVWWESNRSYNSGKECKDQHKQKHKWLERNDIISVILPSWKRVSQLVWHVYTTLLWKITAEFHNYQWSTEIMSKVAVTSGASNCWGQLHAFQCFWHPAVQNSGTINYKWLTSLETLVFFLSFYC